MNYPTYGEIDKAEYMQLYYWICFLPVLYTRQAMIKIKYMYLAYKKLQEMEIHGKEKVTNTGHCHEEVAEVPSRTEGKEEASIK